MRKTVLAAMVMCVGLLAGTAPAWAQAVDEVGLRQLEAIDRLTEEVRKLRLAMTRSEAAQVRASILLDRIRAENARLERIQQELNGLREGTQGPMIAFEENEFVEQMEARILSANPEERREAERQLEQFERRRKMMEEHRERMRRRLLETEQEELRIRDHLEELNDRLEDLERELAVQGRD